MQNGKTIDMIQFTRSLRFYPTPVKPTTPRDRTLSGKARVKARKAARR